MAEPKLRFKDEQGREYPEWIVQKLEELVSMHARIGWQNLRTSEFLNSGDYYLVTGTDFVNGKIDFSTCHYIGKERFEQDKKIQLDNDNILITKDGTLGKVAYVDILPKPTTLNAGIFCLKSKKQNINMKYLFQYLRGPFMMQYCNRHSTGGTIKHLNQGVLITFPVPLPSLSEQQKIADFLTTVDRQIDIQSQRVEAMKTRKKGLLQKIFSQEIRFKDDEGKEFPEWDKKGFAEIAVLLNGDRSDKYPKPQELFSEGIPFINAGNLKNGKVYPVDYITKDKYLSMGGAKLKPEDILFCLRGTVGKNAMFFENEGALASSLAAIRVNDENVSIFWIQYMNSIEFGKKLSGLITGLAQPNLSGRDLMCLRVPVPSLPEQQKIADFLTAVDHQIEVEEKRLETMKTIKKGLLQQMFI